MLYAINGFAKPALHAVVQTFKKQLQFAGGGAALCIYHQGEPIADIWAGTRNPQGDLWLKETPAVSLSTSKGVLATLLHIILQQANIKYETQVSHIWPSFKQYNKAHLTIGQILCHESALFNTSQHIEHLDSIYDWDHMVWSLAKAKPSMQHLGEPCYHAYTFGWLVGELIHRLTGQFPGSFLDSELRSIMGRNNFIGVPDRALHEVSHLFLQLENTNTRQGFAQKMQRKASLGLTQLLRHSKATCAAFEQSTLAPLDLNSQQFLQAQIPAMNGVFTARGLAKLYTILAQPNESKHTALINQPRRATIATVQSTGKDRILHMPMHWRLGYHRLINMKAKAPHGFGHFGEGGSGAWCDPSRQLAVGLTLNTLWGSPVASMRMAEITGKILLAIDQLHFNQNSHE